MKKETTFAVLMITIGIIGGLLTTALIGAIAIPQYAEYLMPVKQTVTESLSLKI